MLKTSSLSTLLLGILCAITLSGCGTLERRAAVPPNKLTQAKVTGEEGVRYLISTQQGVSDLIRDYLAIQKQIAPHFRLQDSSYLSLSGGGDNGAFGAGLLVGWTQQGSRPEFKLVTGVSTGALIAPFAYLGKKYDPVLKEVYTNISPRDIYIPKNVLFGVFSDGFADPSPLYKLISKHVTLDFLKEVAHEYQVKGRWLMIGTTNLDSGIPVIWNMGKIASIGTPEALDLFRRILLASASIPGAFPPTLFDILVDGELYQEMHVDGGATTQVFLYPSAAAYEIRQMGIERPKNRRAYVIRNSRLDPNWSQTERRTISIAGRAISQLIQSQGIGDLYRIYNVAKDDGVQYNLAFIGSDFKEEHKEEFDTDYMRALYQYGYDAAIKGYSWHNHPPGFKRSIEEDTQITSSSSPKKKLKRNK